MIKLKDFNGVEWGIDSAEYAYVVGKIAKSKNKKGEIEEVLSRPKWVTTLPKAIMYIQDANIKNMIYGEELTLTRAIEKINAITDYFESLLKTTLRNN